MNMPAIDIILAVASVLSALVALGSALKASASAKSVILSKNALIVSMYREFNAFTVAEISLVGALTPYSKESNNNDVETKMRIFFLNLFNRWRFDIGTPEQEAHIYFREKVMGHHISKFADLIKTNRSYDESTANKCVKVLRDIYEREPYYEYDGRRFWNVYFRDYFDSNQFTMGSYSL
jgi:hypothetical protein